MSRQRVLREMYQAQKEMPDPGTGGTITPVHYGQVCNIVTTTTETLTLARPTQAGMLVTVALRTDGGTLTLTVTGGYDVAGNTTLVFDDAGDFATFISIKQGSSYVWKLAASEGIPLAAPNTPPRLRVNADVAAAGSNQAGATAVYEGITSITGADNAVGVRLPTGVVGANFILINNNTDKTLKVYPPTAGNINGAGANNAITVAANMTTTLYAVTTGTWFGHSVVFDV